MSHFQTTIKIWFKIEIFGNITRLVEKTQCVVENLICGCFIKSVKTRRPLKVVQLNLCLNIYLNQLIFIIGVNSNESQVLCKLVSIMEHYFNLSTFFWTFLISLHLYRMVSELRDVNKIGVSTPVFYYLVGYIAPLIMVSLSLGIKNDIYTNYQATVNFLNYPKYKLDISSVYCWLNINNYNEIFFIFILPIGTMTLLVLLLSMLSYKESKKNTFNQTDLNLVNQNVLSVIVFLPFNCLMTLFLFLFLSASLTSQVGSAMVYQHLFAVCSLIFSVVIFASFFVLDNENREYLVNLMANKLDNCKKIAANEASLKVDKNFMEKIEVVNVNNVNAKYMAYRDFNTQSFSTTSTSENTDNSQISEYVKHMFMGNQNGYFPNLINTTNTDTTESEYNYNYDLNKLNGINNTQSIQECDVVDVGKVLKAKNPSIQNVIGESYRCRSPFTQNGNYVYSPTRFNQDVMTGMNTLPKVNKPMQISPQYSENMSVDSKNSLVHINPGGTIERKYFKKANIASVASIKMNTSVNIDTNLNHDDNETRCLISASLCRSWLLKL
ncbi:cadherin EGF LAG seven-pass G-type receptor 2-like isoform X1 [Brachionus plicatilis]|uniref:Cadherin EGF LAG seven-pass G-type receptor 2-like isoform X1 n=1 Tax=Brachionus plicatilis TaxID=10195 RepID=A0A3M7PET6_BRAPC|nr:cadherin EGF LAG seven-pass G-type receptor 2-like isoform X1 [Brachionus plicatilis]